MLRPTAAAPLLVLVGDAEELVPDGEAELLLALVPLSCFARFKNALKLRGEVCTGLTAKTMPAPQCEEPSGACCLQ